MATNYSSFSALIAAPFFAAAFQFWCPGVYADYHRRLSTLFQRRPDLERIFPRSIFPTAAFLSSGGFASLAYASIPRGLSLISALRTNSDCDSHSFPLLGGS